MHIKSEQKKSFLSIGNYATLRSLCCTLQGVRMCETGTEDSSRVRGKRDQNPGALRDQGQEVSQTLEKPAEESEKT